MMEPIAAAAALLAATTLPAGKTLHVPNDPPTSLKTSEHVRVQTERRRAIRAAIAATCTLESLRPMLERARIDSALLEARDLLDAAEDEYRSGRREHAMLNLDGATFQLDTLSGAARANANLRDVFQDLERREIRLRERLGQPAAPYLFPADADDDKESEPAVDAIETDPPAPRKLPDQLPVA